MSEQNFKNHGRIVPMFHYAAFAAALFPLIVAGYNFFQSIGDQSGRLNAAAIFSLAIALNIALWYTRVFALRAQDRAIRAEENMRHYIATGKLLDNRLTMRQIIGLRFAGDGEFLDLAKRAVEENLTEKQIKMAVTSWKADHNRV